MAGIKTGMVSVTGHSSVTITVPRLDRGVVTGEQARLMEALALLFIRVEQLQGADRVRFEVKPLRAGVEYEAAVYLEAYVRMRGDESPGDRRRSAKGPGPDGAVRALLDHLAQLLRMRLKADVGALTLAGMPLEPEFFAEGWGRTVAHPPQPGEPVVVDGAGEAVEEDVGALALRVASSHVVTRKKID